MINQNKCPQCSKTITSVKVEDVVVEVEFRPKWKGFSYGCPHCRAVLGVQINPLLVADEIVDSLKKA
jgi:ribulose 1,5-bisphosphate carboxylase large subunit-like protein